MNSQTGEMLYRGVRSTARDYLVLCKWKVVSVLLLTALVGMLLASDDLPPLRTLVLGLVGIGMLASAAAVLNHLVDRRLDSLMLRTANRPLPKGRVTPRHALVFAFFLAITGSLLLSLGVNVLAAWLTLGALVGYALIYSYWLKRSTPQNIVIGGLAGASPPLLGWVCVTGEVSMEPLILVAIIFAWTPPHFWALCIYKRSEYARAKIPMMPVVNGDRYTVKMMLLYTILLCCLTLLPVTLGTSGWLYFLAICVLNGRFLYWIVCLLRQPVHTEYLATFLFSIKYIMWLFAALLLDHYLLIAFYSKA